MSTVLKSVSVPITTITPVKPSKWLWVPWVWLFFAATRTPSTWLSWGKGTATADQIGAGSPLDRVIMGLLMLLGLFVLGMRWKEARRILIRNKWVVILYIYLSLSVLWSNFPDISFRRCNRCIGTLEMVLIVLTERDVFKAVRTMLQSLYIVHIIGSVMAIKYFRNIGVVYNWSGSEEQWVGLTTDKNSLGQVVMCSGLFYVWKLIQDWPTKKTRKRLGIVIVDLLLLGGSLWMLRGSKNIHSSTAIVGFLICAMILLALQLIKGKKRHAKRIVLVAGAALVVVIPVAYVTFQALDVNAVQAAFQSTGRDMSFTDRTLIWTDVLNDTKKTAMFGVGIGAFWVGPIGYDLYPMPNWSLKTPEWRPEEGHNGFIDAYAELGVVGLVLLIIVIVTGFASALNQLRNDFQFGTLRLVLLISIVLNNVTETSFLKGTHDFWFLFLLLAMDVPGRFRRASGTYSEFSASSLVANEAAPDPVTLEPA